MSAFKSTNTSERRAALRIITYFGYDGSLALCLEALQSDDDKLRDIALGGLPALDEPSVPAVLAGAAHHSSGRTRASAIRALGHVRLSPETEATLRAGLEDPDAWVRYYACQSLGRLAVVAALPALRSRLDDEAGQVKMAAVEALAALPARAAARALAEAASSADVDVQRAAVVGAGERAEPELRPVVVAALGNQDPSIRLVAVSSIARFEGAEAELAAAAQGDTDGVVARRGLEPVGQSQRRRGVSRIARLAGARSGVDRPGRGAQPNGRRPHRDHFGGARDSRRRAGQVAVGGVVALAVTAGPSGARRSARFAQRRGAARGARVMSLLLDDSAKSSLARAASADGDAEVRRICAAALA